MSESQWRRTFRLGRSRVKHDVDDEVAFHFAMRVEQFIIDALRALRREPSRSGDRAARRLAAATARAAVFVDHALAHEFVLRQRLLTGMMLANVCDVAIVVGNTDHTTNDTRRALDRFASGCDCLSRGHWRNPPTAAAVCVLPRR